MAVAAAAVVFASCEKDQFTEKNALDLDLMRLRVQDSIANVVRTAQYRQDIKVLQYQRMIDSLTAIDAGGKVYYSFIPYNGTLGVTSSGGRVEGITTAKATAFAGQSKEAAPVAFEATSKNGVYVFPAMYSGEVTVAVEAPGFSTLNFTANLTPDGPVANGKVVYVGNVVPLFETGTGETAANFTKTARIQGRAWVETDITNGVEETIPDDANYAVTVQIDTERGNVFRTRFIQEGNDEGQGVQQSNQGSSSTTRSGFIQRFAYEFAERGTTNQNVLGRTLVRSGAYAVLAPASMSGLPIKMEFDEYAADRRFFRNDQVITARHIYGPNVQADVVPNGVTQPSLTFQAVREAAEATVTYTPRAVTTALTVTAGNNDAARLGNGITAGNGNAWAVRTPTVVSVNGAGGSGAAASVGMIAKAAGNTYGDFQTVRAWITNGGTGFSSNDNTVTIQYTDHLDIGTLRQATSTGGGGISRLVRIRNGGHSFFPSVPNANGISQTGLFTNRRPDVYFFLGGQNISTSPIAGVNTPQAQVVIDQTVGAVSFISVTNPGSGLGSVAPTVGFGYEVNALTLTGSSAAPIFVTTGATGGLTFTSSVVGDFLSANTVFSQAAEGNNYSLAESNAVIFPTGTRARYTFVPQVSFNVFQNGIAIPTTSYTAPTIGIEVFNNPNTPFATAIGGIRRITMVGGSGFNSNIIWNQGTSFLRADITISISFRAANDNPLAAYPTELEGSGLNNYAFTAVTPPLATGFDPSGGANAPVNPTYNFGFANWDNQQGVVDQQRANTTDALAMVTASPWLIVAEAPSAAVANPRTAYGVPILNNSVIAGVRMLDGGSGYENRAQGYTLQLIPNPFFVNHGTVSVNAFNVQIRGVNEATISAVSNTQAIKGIGARAVELVNARYNVSTPARQGSVGNFIRRTTPASVTVTLTKQGAGYAEVPSLVIFDGGLPFNASRALSNVISGSLRIVNSNTSANTNGALTFGNVDGGNGTATAITYNGVEVPGNGGNGYGESVDNPTIIYNTNTIKAVVIDRLGETLTEEFANPAKVAGEIRINELGQVASILVTPGRTIAFQTVNGVSFNTAKGWAAFTPLTFNVPPTLILRSLTGTGARAVIDPAQSTLPDTNPINTGTGLNPVWVNASGITVGTIVLNSTTTTTPTVTTTVSTFTTITSINPVTGVTTTQTIVTPTTVTGGTTTVTSGTPFLENSTATRIGFQIRNIRVENGGSGYQQGNWYHNSGFTGTGTTIIGNNSRAPYTNEIAAAQPFRIIGGVRGGTVGGSFDLNESNATERNDRFDVFPGNTYVRDIHLGTGHEVE